MKLVNNILLMSVLISGNIRSADVVNLNVTGNIIASPCVFNNGDDNKNINLGEFQAMNMKTPGSSSDPVSFSLVFTQCPAGTQSVTATFTGTPDPSAGSDYYMNSGTAKNIAIALTDTDSGALKGNGSSITRPIADSMATMAMQANIQSLTGNVLPGTVSAVVVVTMQYN
jgi:P pilus assembly protein, pilin FimA